jgi:RNA polymerase-interacting CarD/CdnL/TRCF family regulator
MNHGVATIENISSRAFAGHFERFYLLHLTYNRLTVMVPFSHVEELRLRKVTRNQEVARVISFLSEDRCHRDQTWKDRFKENTERMRELQGDISLVMRGDTPRPPGQFLPWRQRVRAGQGGEAPRRG